MATNLTSTPDVQCQICESKQNLTDIQTPKFVHLVSKIEAITDSQVEHRNWLRFVCFLCTAKLDHLWKFQNLCKNAYRKFVETLDTDPSLDIIEKYESEESDEEEEEEKYPALQTLFLWEGTSTERTVIPVESKTFRPIKLQMVKSNNNMIIKEEEEIEICDEEENIQNTSLPGIDATVYDSSCKTEVQSVEISPKRSNSPKKFEDFYAKLINEGHKRSLEVKRVNLEAPGKEDTKKPQTKTKDTKIPRKEKPMRNESCECSICDKKFKHKQGVRSHMREVHQQILRFVCDVCGKGFKRNNTYRDHLETHSEKRSQFSCAICNKTFTLKTNLLRHIIGIHIDRSRRQICKSFCRHCKSRFNTREEYIEHVKTHPFARINGFGKKPKTCSTCSKKFKTSQALEAHERIHTGEKPFTCKICSKTFRQDQHLRMHMNIHTGAKKYPCEYCDKVFTQAGNLRVHRRIHTGEKPYECSNCSERFHEQKMWKKHNAKCSEES